MKTKAYNTLWVEHFCGDPCRVRLIKPLRAYCETLDRVIEAPAGFVNDFESMLFIRGSNHESGVWHDYFSRKNSDPVVSKTVCAQIYLEFQKYYDLQEGGVVNTALDFTTRWFKTGVVWVWPGYFHQLLVMATYKDIVGRDEPMLLEDTEVSDG